MPAAAVLAVAGVLAAGSPPAQADSCSISQGSRPQGWTGGTRSVVCLGSGTSTIGNDVGQIATVVGPSTAPTSAGSVVTAAGDVND